MIARSRRQLAPLTAEGKRYLVRDHMAAIVQLALALGFARSLGWLNAWLYGGLLVAAKVTSALLLTRINPAVVNARGARHLCLLKTSSTPQSLTFPRSRQASLPRGLA